MILSILRLKTNGTIKKKQCRGKGCRTYKTLIVLDLMKKVFNCPQIKRNRKIVFVIVLVLGFCVRVCERVRVLVCVFVCRCVFTCIDDVSVVVVVVVVLPRVLLPIKREISIWPIWYRSISQWRFEFIGVHYELRV